MSKAFLQEEPYYLEAPIHASGDFLFLSRARVDVAV